MRTNFIQILFMTSFGRVLSSMTTPGLAFRPQPEEVLSTLLHFKHGYSGNWRPLDVKKREIYPIN
jgi:hypothetical protein